MEQPRLACARHAREQNGPGGGELVDELADRFGDWHEQGGVDGQQLGNPPIVDVQCKSVFDVLRPEGLFVAGTCRRG